MNKTNKKIKIGMFLLLGILLISFASAYMRSSLQYTQPGFSSSFSEGYWRTDSSMCEAGQDFILQIAPFGCTPAVVRSDLLEEQNVPVFCQIAATKINPLIKVEAIESISFSGKYPNEVSGIGFHPAKAALGVNGNLNSPILNNIGYVVIVLKKQKNESSMPDFVQGNLTAKIKYDIKNAYGIGKATFYLPVIKDSDWENNKNQYSFWNGRGYLRAEGVDVDGATIVIYDGTNRRISRVDLDKGKTSQKIYMPGFDCLAGLQLKLHDLEAPDTRAKLNINGEIVEVAKKELFLENKCRVTKIDKKGLVQEVSISCKEDERRKSYNLRISPKIKLDFDGAKPEGYEVGEKLPFSDDKNKNVYLGYIGTVMDTGREEDLYIRFVQTPRTGYDENKLTDEMISEVDRYNKCNLDAQTGGLVKRIAKYLVKNPACVFERFTRYIVQGSEVSNGLGYNYENTFYGTKVSIIGFADTENTEFKEDTKEYYNKAIEDYDNIINGYSTEKYDILTYGEEALFKKIELAFNTEQKKLVAELCEEFKERYPDSKKELKEYCDDKFKLSSSDISNVDVIINGIIKSISLDGIYEPDFEDCGVVVSITNAKEDYSGIKYLRKNDVKSFSDFEYLVLKEIHEDYALFDVSSVDEGLSKNIWWKKGLLKIELNNFQVIGKDNYKISVEEINLKKQAKVSVIPSLDNAGTEANFSFKIGIEKRAIQLSPEKIREKIENLDKTIADWEDKSKKLGTVVKGLKGACLATGAFLTIKNFFANTGGKSIARQNVMRGEAGINDMCADAINGKGLWKDKGYKSINECFTKEYKYIDNMVDARYKIMQASNNNYENLQKGITKTNFLGEEFVNDEKLAEKLFTKDRIENLKTNLEKCGKKTVNVGGEEVSIDNIVNTNLINKDTFTISQFRDLELEAASCNNNLLKNMAVKRLNKTLADVYVNYNEQANMISFEEDSTKYINNPQADSYGLKDSVVGIYRGATMKGNNPEIKTGTPVQLITFSHTEYYLTLKKTNRVGEYVIENVYDKNWHLLTDDKKVAEGSSYDYSVYYDSNVAEIKKNIRHFKQFDEKTYKNPYKSSIHDPTSPILNYYETEPYKGMPATVPFDCKEGWYASIKQTLPIFGNIASYDKSGRVTSFYVCNVGKNNKEENRGGDDICQMINTGTGQPYNVFYGLSSGKASTLVQNAVKAVEDASRRYKSGLSGYVSIGNCKAKVGKPAIDIPDIQCQDFMSPKDCQLLFNVCDPVICPPSRCNFGGSFHVKDVIQSGIIGSIALCLPNVREGIYVPICLTGIKAGIDGWLSIAKAHRDCLQDALDDGKMVGICDEIYSIHLCEFFWRQGLPLAQIAIPKITEWIMGQNVRGGGEYLGVANAWSNVEKSVGYFTQYYAANSYKAFKARSAEEVGGEICKSYISGVYPESGNLLDALVEPDSPPQFHGRFDEIPFTTVTSPPISQYKVYYHIYAGKDSRAYYQVYLKGDSGSSFYRDTGYKKVVASGFIAKGDYASETKDFTAPSGYKELCIVVNGQEECGFKQVSTSFAVDYMKDKYMEEQAEKKDIKTEKECIAGSASLYSLLSPSLQGAGEELINPEIYNRGIIRICATKNPGVGTDGKAMQNGSRWVDVGYCDDENIKCWLDTESVENVIHDLDIEAKVLKEQNENYQKILQNEGGYLSEEEINTEINRIIEEKDNFEKISMINKIFDKVFLNHQKANLLLFRGNAYAELAKTAKKKIDKENIESKVDEGMGSGYEPEEGDEDEGMWEGYSECDIICNEEDSSYFGEKISSGEECAKKYGSNNMFYLEDEECCCYKRTEDYGSDEGSEEDCSKNYNFNPNRYQKDVRSAITSSNLVNDKCLDYVSLLYNENGFKYKNSIPDPLLLIALIQHESNGCNPDATDGLGSYGLMQIHQNTFSEICNSISTNFEKIKGQGNVQNNIDCGIKILENKKKFFDFNCDNLQCNHPFSNSASSNGQVKCYTNINQCGFKYKCNNKNKYYCEWEAVLRAYNGWSCKLQDGSDANINYVEDIMEIYEDLGGDVSEKVY